MSNRYKNYTKIPSLQFIEQNNHINDQHAMSGYIFLYFGNVCSLIKNLTLHWSCETRSFVSKFEIKPKTLLPILST